MISCTRRIDWHKNDDSCMGVSVHGGYTQQTSPTLMWGHLSCRTFMPCRFELRICVSLQHRLTKRLQRHPLRTLLFAPPHTTCTNASTNSYTHLPRVLTAEHPQLHTPCSINPLTLVQHLLSMGVNSSHVAGSRTWHGQWTIARRVHN